MPGLLDEEVTATYAGLRAATEHGDYQVRIDPDAGYLCLGGIRSTGLTASMALAEYAAALLAEAGLDLRPRADLPDPPRMPNIGEAQTRPYEDAARIAADPGVRRDRLLLRAGHPRRDPRRPGVGDPARRPRRAAPAHPGDDGPLPGILLRRPRRAAAGGAR